MVEMTQVMAETGGKFNRYEFPRVP